MSSPDRAAGERPATDLGPDVATETQALFLVRLRNLVEKRQQAGKVPEEQLHLIDKAIYSTFCDCLELGLSAQARSILKTLPPR